MMKLLIVSLVVAALGFAAWQRAQIVELRQMEQRLVSEAAVHPTPTQPSAATPGVPAVDQPSESRLSDEDFTRFTSQVMGRRRDFETERFYKFARVSAGNWAAFPDLCEPLSRLSPAQLLTVLKEWTGGKPIQRGGEEGPGRFLMLAERVNPAALVKLIYQLQEEKDSFLAAPYPQMALQYWFRQDSDELLRWARAVGTPGGFENACAIWADAAEVVREPSVENVRRFLGHGASYEAKGAAAALVSRLRTDEARLQYFQSLHTVTKGKVANPGTCLGSLPLTTPFGKLAHLADALPPFEPADPAARPFFYGEPIGSLRYEVAASSRDGTAEQRWRWLLQRPADAPSGKLLLRLTREWRDQDFADTAAWARSLPPGPDRQTVFRDMEKHLKQHGKGELAKEWTAP